MTLQSADAMVYSPPDERIGKTGRSAGPRLRTSGPGQKGRPGVLIEETFTIDAPKAEVAAFLLDVDRMGGCVPGVEGLKRLDDDRYEASLSVRMGPIQAKFKGDVAIDASGAPDAIVASASGRDAATGSVAQVKFSAELTENGTGSTSIRSVSDVTIRGRLGQFGSGVVSATAREMVKSFAQCAGHQVGATTGGAAEPASPDGLASIVMRGIVSWLKGLWVRIRGSGPGDSA